MSRAEKPVAVSPGPRRSPWRERWRARWRQAEWPSIWILASVALSLGCVGFHQYFRASGQGRSLLDLFYLSLQLFVLESGAVPGRAPWALEVARFLAPFISAYTATKALTVIFRDQMDLLRARRLKNHVVICGLGRKGVRLARAFRERGDSVVVLERDEDNDHLVTCRRLGAIALVGDATDPEVLGRAGVARAKHLIAVCGDDGANAEIAVRARELRTLCRGTALDCLVHIFDPQLGDLLREQELARAQEEEFRLEFFNVFQQGAGALLNELSWRPATAQPVRPPHLLVVGLGKMGESLVVQAANEWRAVTASGERLQITLVDRAALERRDTLVHRYPALESRCTLAACPIDVRSPEFERAAFALDSNGQPKLSAAYVCLDDDSLGLSAALALHRQLREHRVPIVVRMNEEAGLATLLGRGKGGDAQLEELRAFGLLDRTCRPEVLLGSTHERLARAIHEQYVRNNERHGQTRRTNPVLVPWDELSEDLKESNRSQVDDIGHKLTAIGCELAPLRNWDAQPFALTTDEVERLARLEHDRWLSERRLAGWSYAPEPKDVERKKNPNLRPWEELADDARENARDTARGLPSFLAGVGFEIRRRLAAPQSSPRRGGPTTPSR